MEFNSSQGAARTIHGHVSALPETIATLFNGHTSQVAEPETGVAIFAINPSAGIDAETIAIWETYNDLLVPRIIVVLTMDGASLDFDDAVMLVNRVLDQCVTPYLVLHNDEGNPTALISLLDLKTFDYTTNPATVGDADDELAEMVADFRDEFIEQMHGLDESAFSAGLIFPAIPIGLGNSMGVDVVIKYLALLPSSS